MKKSEGKIIVTVYGLSPEEMEQFQEPMKKFIDQLITEGKTGNNEVNNNLKSVCLPAFGKTHSCCSDKYEKWYQNPIVLSFIFVILGLIGILVIALTK